MKHHPNHWPSLRSANPTKKQMLWKKCVPLTSIFSQVKIYQPTKSIHPFQPKPRHFQQRLRSHPSALRPSPSTRCLHAKPGDPSDQHRGRLDQKTTVTDGPLLGGPIPLVRYVGWSSIQDGWNDETSRFFSLLRWPQLDVQQLTRWANFSGPPLDWAPTFWASSQLGK